MGRGWQVFLTIVLVFVALALFVTYASVIVAALNLNASVNRLELRTQALESRIAEQSTQLRTLEDPTLTLPPGYEAHAVPAIVLIVPQETELEQDVNVLYRLAGEYPWGVFVIPCARFGTRLNCANGSLMPPN